MDEHAYKHYRTRNLFFTPRFFLYSIDFFSYGTTWIVISFFRGKVISPVALENVCYIHCIYVFWWEHGSTSVSILNKIRNFKEEFFSKQKCRIIVPYLDVPPTKIFQIFYDLVIKSVRLLNNLRERHLHN